MNILVIGGTRFFGIHMVNELLAAGHDVTIATRGKASDSFGDKVKRIFLERTKEESVREALSGTHYDVVIDNMNLSKKYVDDLEAKAKEANYEIVIKSFKDVPLDVCIERDSKRELSIGKSVITALHKKYLA